MRMICPIKNKLETNRWLKALEIAKVIFDDEGYHILYLEQLENFIRSKRMYSPKVREILVPKLYLLSKEKKMTMVGLVNKIIEEYLEKNMGKQDQRKVVASVNG